MSTDLSEEFLAAALEMFEADGVPVSIVSRSPGTMTASGDRQPAAAPRTSAGIILPSRGKVVIDGVEKASERVLMAPVDPWPVPGDRIVINGRTLTIGDDGAKTYAPQGIPILHDLAVAS